MVKSWAKMEADMKCPSCGSIYYVKNGNIRHKQRYKCYDCGCTYTQATWKGRHSLTCKKAAVTLYLKGKTAREIKKEMGIADTTVLTWVRLLIENISHIDRIMEEFDWRLDELNKLKELQNKIKKEDWTFPLSVKRIRKLYPRYLNTLLMLIRHRPKQRKKSNKSLTKRCSKLVKPSVIKEGSYWRSPTVVKINGRKVKCHPTY